MPATPSSLRVEYSFLSFIGLIVTGTAATLIGPAFPLIMIELEISMGMLGLIASVWNVGYALSVIGGSLVDRFGEPRILLFSFLLTGVSIGLVSISPTYIVLLLLILAAGIGSAFEEASMNSLIAGLYQQRRGFGLSILHTCWSLGCFIGPVLAGYIIVTYGSWRMPFLVSSLLFIPLIGFTTILMLRTRSLPEQSFEVMRESISPKFYLIIIVIGLAAFFYMGAELAVNAWLPSFINFKHGWALDRASFTLSVFWVSLTLGRLLLGAVVDKVGYKNMIQICSLICVPIIFLATRVEYSYSIIGLWALTGFLFGPIMPTMMAWVSTVVPSKRGFAIGVIYSIGYAGAVFAPWLVGAISDLLTLKTALLYLVFSLFMTFLLITSRRRTTS